MIDGELGPRQMLPPRLYDKTILALAERVQAEVNPAYEQAFPARAYADVEVTSWDGRRFAARVKQASWEPPDTLPGDTELAQKFRWLVAPVFGAERAEAVIRLIWQFEQQEF